MSQLLTLPPASASDPSAAATGSSGATPTADPGTTDPLAPVTDADRTPIPVPIDDNSLLHPTVVQPDPGTGNTVSQILGDEVPVLAQGGEDYDAYSPEKGVGTHFLALYPELVNEQTASGKWVDLPSAITTSTTGFQIKGKTFTIDLPTVIGQGPITSTRESSVLSVSPISTAPVAGQLLAGVLTYPGAWASTDLQYRVDSGGYKESLILASPDAGATFSWSVATAGLDASLDADGTVVFSSATDVIWQMPTPAVTDANNAPIPSVFALTPQGPGAWTLTLTLDAVALAAAAFPVLVDPGSVQPTLNADTYVDSGQATSGHGTLTQLITGPATGTSSTRKYRSFLRFGTGWQDANMVIYGAVLHLHNVSEATDANKVSIARATWNWDQSMTWNSMMSQTGEGVDAANPAISDQGGTKAGWWTLDLAKLYQTYVEGPYTDYGFRLTSADKKVFDSSESANTPYLIVSYDTLPTPPVTQGPKKNSNGVVPTFASRTGLSLEVGGLGADVDGDSTLVRYQVTNDNTKWSCAGSGDYCSGWIDETSYDVASSWLQDGGTFWWRVQVADQCNTTSGLCDTTRPDTTTKPWNTTTAWQFVVSLKNRGIDGRFAMFSRRLGNGIRLAVNESNGNAVVHVPLGRVSTPLGQFPFSLSYNSQAAAEGTDLGLGEGWRLWAGPESSGGQIPTKIATPDPAPWAGVEITFASGNTETIPWRIGHTWAVVGGGMGTVKQNANNNFIYRTSGGDVYWFDSDGNPTKARPVSTKPAAASAANPFYRYTFDANQHLTQVLDPLDRAITFDWTVAGQVTITTWSSDVWTIYLSGGRVVRITDPIALAGQAGAETVQFSYSSVSYQSPPTVMLLTGVENGEQYGTYPNTPSRGWELAYIFDTNPAGTTFDLDRVSQVAEPGASLTGNYWSFTYGSGGPDYIGSTSKTTKITDPRGLAPGVQHFELVDFNDVGLPIRDVAPKDASADPSYVTTTLWNTLNQILCTRGPAANAIALGCTGVSTADQMNHEWIYGAEAPYRLLTEKAPAPAGQTRMVTNYDWDQGAGFTGLWTEYFSNPDLSGLPADEGRTVDFDQNWGSGTARAALPVNNWSLRMSGLIFGTAGTTYEFQVTGDDGYTLVIDNSVLLDCWSLADPGVNCGQSAPPKKKFWDPDHSIVVEYHDTGTSTANLKIQWRVAGTTTWTGTLLSENSLSPDLGLLTDKWISPGGVTTDPLRMHQEWTYAGEDYKTTRLPDAHNLWGASGGSRSTTFLYDEWGRKTQITNFAGTSSAAVTTRTYTDSATRSCLNVVKRLDAGASTGFSTDHNCNPDGQTTSITRTIRAVTSGTTTLQAAQTRTTTFVRDAVGRVVETDTPAGGATWTSYDRSGRVTETDLLLAGTPASPTSKATSTIAYNDYPSTGGPTMTETSPDPDGAGSLTGLTTTHTYDWAGNEVSRTDPGSHVWTTTYDAQNRALAVTSPDPDGASSLQPLVTSVVYTLNSSPVEYSVTATDPAGAISKTWMDILGRTAQTQAGNLAPTLFTYDAAGNVTRVEQSQSGTVYSWKENSYNAFHSPTQLREPSLVGGVSGTATTNYTYDVDTGRLASVNGPLADGPTQQDRVDYTWDVWGRRTQTTMWTTSAQTYVTSMIYDDAGELVRLTSGLSADGTKKLVRDATYTLDGLPLTMIEHHGAGPGGTGGTWLADQSTSYAYDVADRLTSVDSPRFSGTQDLNFVLDDLGRETSRYRLSGSTHLDQIDTAYGPDGTVLAVSRGGTAYTYDHYDALGRLTSLSGGGSTTSWSFYGTSTENNRNGLLKAVSDTIGTDPALTTTYDYYVSGDTLGTPGSLKQVTDPLTSGTVIYTYDAAGRVITRKDSAAALTWTRTYEAPTSRVDTQAITKTGSSPVKTWAFFDLGYDKAGNVTSRAQKLWKTGTTSTPSSTASDTGTGAWTYAYDGAGRMTSAAGPSPAGTATTTTYGYDGLGDRLSVSDAATTLTTTTDDQGWPTTADSTGGAPDVVYSWNPDGSLAGIDDQVTNANDRTFGYDAWGGTSSATAGSTTLTYGLDAFERTASRTQAGVATTLTYQGGTETLVKATPSTGSATSFSSTPGGPLSAKTGTATVESLRDLHGDTVGTFTASSGTTAMSDETWYSPFGEPTALAGGLPLLGYQGDLTDPSTGEVDMLTRQYVPTLGRFSTRDVLGGDPASPPSLNQWVYAAGNPVSNTDLSGMGCDPSMTSEACSTPTTPSTGSGTDSAGGGGCRPHEGCSGSTGSGDNAGPDQASGPLDEDQARKLFFQYGPVISRANLQYARDAAAEFGVDPYLLIALMIVEGSGRQECETCAEEMEKIQVANQVNPSIGIMQMQFLTFKGTTLNHISSFGGPGPHVTYGVFDEWRIAFSARMRDEQTAIRYGAAYLSDIRSQVRASDRDKPAVLAGVYNGGIGRYAKYYVPSGSFRSSADNYVAQFSSPSGVYAQVQRLF